MRIVEAGQIAIQAFKVCPMIFRVLFTDEVVCRQGARVPRLALNASSYMHESIMMVVIIIPSFFSTSRLSSLSTFGPDVFDFSTCVRVAAWFKD